MSQIVWVSLNPNTCNIEIYSKDVAGRLERAFWACEKKCLLGEKYNNATVHFNISGIIYQITPAIIGKHHFIKSPSYKSVKRCEVKNDYIVLSCVKKNREWRIDDKDPFALKISKYIESGYVIDEKKEVTIKEPQPWTYEDLLSDNKKLVVCWESKRGMYSNKVNRLIEIGYRSEYEEAKINTEDRGEVKIVFREGKIVLREGEEIEIERKIIPISKIKEKLRNRVNVIEKTKILSTKRVNSREYIYL